jgi:hypothetical protein
MAKQTAAMTAYLHITTGPSSEYIRFGGKAVTGTAIQISSRMKLVIGRNPQIVNLQIYDLADDSSISRIHCSIHFDNELNRFMLTDESSANGTYLNNERMNPHETTQLHHGDTIELGRVWKNGIQFLFAIENMNIHEARKRVVLRSDQKVKGTGQVPLIHNIAELLQEKKKAAETGAPVSEETARVFEMIDHAFPNEGKVASTKTSAANDYLRGTVPIDSSLLDKYDVFISYSRENKNAMEAIFKFLSERHDLSVWTDKRIITGVNWQAEIEKNIADSYCFLILLSPSAKTSEWVQLELTCASSHKLPIFPALLEGDEHNAIPIKLLGTQYAKLNGDKYEAALAIEQLANAIKAKLSELKGKAMS